MKFTLVLVILGVMTLVVWGLSTGFPGVLDNDFAQADLMYSVMLLVLIAPGILYAFRGNVGKALKYALVWGGIFAVMFVVMAYREELTGVSGHLRAQLNPSAPLEAAGGITLTRAQDEHFYAEAFVNGASVRFMVDSGASRVSLSYEDAKRIGIMTQELNYSMPVNTANGITMNAPITLEYVMVGSLRIANVKASVAKPEQMDGSLLGMSYLSRLGGWKVQGNTMHLWQEEGAK